MTSLYIIAGIISLALFVIAARTLETGVVRMSINGVLQIALYLVVLIALASPWAALWRGSIKASPRFQPASWVRSSDLFTGSLESIRPRK